MLDRCFGMALAAPLPEYRPAVDRLHYFRPLRALVSVAAIAGAEAGLVFWSVTGGTSATAATNRGLAQTVLVTFFLLVAVVGAFLPRTLTADTTEIRWKRFGRPGLTAPRAQVREIQYLPTAGPGKSRYYLVNRDGQALLWIDRFRPSQMESFASYLGVPMHTVYTAPPLEGKEQNAFKASAGVGRKRVYLMGCGVGALLLSAVPASVASITLGYQAEWAAYRRAGVCSEPPVDRQACRYQTQATVTRIDQRGRIYFTLPVDYFTFGDHRSTWVQLASGGQLDAPIEVGKSARMELFNGTFVVSVNSAATADFVNLQSDTSWLLTGLFAVGPLACLIAMVAIWFRPATAFEPKDAPPAKPDPTKGPTLNDPPVVPGQPKPDEKPGAIERVPITWMGQEGDSWPTLTSVQDFDYARHDEFVRKSGIPEAGERLLVKAACHYYATIGTHSILLLTDRRLVVLGPTRLEIPRPRISLLAYWKFKDSVAVTYQTQGGPRGILLTGPQIVLTGGPNTDFHKLFEAMRTALTNPDAIRQTVEIIRPLEWWHGPLTAIGRANHRLWMAWVG